MRWKKGSHKLTALSIALVVLGVLLCILPFTFWVTGALLIALGAFTFLLRLIGSETLRSSLILIVCAGLIALEILMGLLSVQGQRDPAAEQSPAAIVLGAQVRGDVPSMALRSRLDADSDQKEIKKAGNYRRFLFLFFISISVRTYCVYNFNICD